LRLWIMPVGVGTGRRLFEDVDISSLDHALTDVRKFAKRLVHPQLRAQLEARHGRM
jgi:hypothetical protein